MTSVGGGGGCGAAGGLLLSGRWRFSSDGTASWPLSLAIRSATVIPSVWLLGVEADCASSSATLERSHGAAPGNGAALRVSHG
jgi:hypothetical protein